MYPKCTKIYPTCTEMYPQHFSSASQMWLNVRSAWPQTQAPLEPWKRTSPLEPGNTKTKPTASPTETRFHVRNICPFESKPFRIASYMICSKIELQPTEIATHVASYYATWERMGGLRDGGRHDAGGRDGFQGWWFDWDDRERDWRHVGMALTCTHSPPAECVGKSADGRCGRALGAPRL